MGATEKIDTSPDLYVGLPSLQLFDLMIILATEVNREAAALSFQVKRTPLQQAVKDIAPGAFHQVLSIRQLIRSGYLFGAETLLRPLLERCAVVAYLRKHPSKGVDLWSRGWPHKSRPSLKYMIASIDEPPRQGAIEDYPNDYSVTDLLKNRIDHLNRLVHCDPIGASRNAFWSNEHNHIVQFAGPNWNMDAYCDELAGFAAGLTSVLIWEVTTIFELSDRKSTIQ